MRARSALACLATTLLASSLSAAASAQAPAPPPPAAPPPDGPTPAPEVLPAAPPPATTSAAPTPPGQPAPAFGQPAALAPDAPAEADGGARFRWGVSLLGGPLVFGLQGGAAGLDVRLGAQVNRTFGVYAQPVGLVGAGAAVNKEGFSGAGGLFAAGGVGLLADFTIADFFFLAVGPEFMAVKVATFSASLAGIGSATESGTYLSVTGRMGFAFGSMKPNGRKALTLGLHPRVVISTVPFFVAALALGFDSF